MADRRSKNRMREHLAHGWKQRAPQPAMPRKGNQVLVDCPCGWMGWIDRDVAPPSE